MKILSKLCRSVAIGKTMRTVGTWNFTPFKGNSELKCVSIELTNVFSSPDHLRFE